MSARLILVRHGVTDWNEDGRLMGRAAIAINDRGRAQVARVADVLASRGVDAVYASPQLRTRQTAEPIASAHDLEIQIEPGFDEVWLAEAWQGKTVAELRGDPDLDRVIEDPMYRCDAIEPVAEVWKRSAAAAERILESNEDRTLVVVSHGDPLRVLIAHYLRLELAHFRRLACDNGSITSIRFDGLGPRLALLNWVPQSGSGNPAALQSS